MKNYESPVILDNEELAEGVYATGSGGSLISGVCFNHTLTCTYKGNSGHNVITIVGSHRGTHQTDSQLLELTFDQLVTFEKTKDGGVLEGTQTGNKICIRYNKHYTEDDATVSFGEIWVNAGQGVILQSVRCNIICDGAGV